MGGITVYIVLGALILLVVIFLVVTSTLERKKTKKLKTEKIKLDFDVKESGTNVAKKVLKIAINNDKMLKNFVPSIGKHKMSDINLIAKKDLQDLQKSRTFQLIKHNEEEFEHFQTNINVLIKNKSNNWNKNHQKEINFFKNYKYKEPEKEKSKRELKKVAKQEAKKEKKNGKK